MMPRSEVARTFKRVTRSAKATPTVQTVSPRKLSKSRNDRMCDTSYELRRARLNACAPCTDTRQRRLECSANAAPRAQHATRRSLNLAPPLVTQRSTVRHSVFSAASALPRSRARGRILHCSAQLTSPGAMTSSILRIMRTTCVASSICCCLPMRVSKTFCSFISRVPLLMQSMPR